MKSTKKPFAKIIKILIKHYPQKGDMDLGNAKDTLLGVLLSARTTDKQVLKIFPSFKNAFPSFESLAQSSPAEISKYISSIGLYRSKAKAIYGLANIICQKFAGHVPSSLNDLISLPGIGRKSANCVLAYVYKQDTICVDTHVFRIAHRLGWSRGKTPEKVEADLQLVIPKKLWKEINRTMVHFGRDICKSGKPECWRCPIANQCEFHPKNLNKKII